MPTQVAEIKRMIFLGSSSWGHPWQGLIWFLPADLVMCELLLNIKFLKKNKRETFLAVQWLRLHTSNAGGVSSIPGWKTKSPQAARLNK